MDLAVRADTRLLLTVEETAERLAIGRSLMYRLMGTGRIGSLRVGRLRRLTPEALALHVAELRTQVR